MPLKLGPPLPPDDPLFQRYTIGFFTAPKPSTSGKSEEKVDEPPKPKPSPRKRKKR